ncbi:hypothetical protein [Paenibacillus sp. KS-LC4]
MLKQDSRYTSTPMLEGLREKLDVAESLLRREPVGIRLERVELA